jgi:hypothetical protein
MAYKTSTGLRNMLLDTGSLKNALDGGFINIYSGPVPDTADGGIDPANTLLCTISVDGLGVGHGLHMDTAAVAGVLAKAPDESWRGTNVASGTASFYRHVASTDTGALSTTEARIQGAVGLVGAELNLSSVGLLNAAAQTIDYYVITLPTL